MLVGIDTSALTHRITGTSRYIYCLLTELKKTGNDIRTFSPHKEINLLLLNKIPFLKRGGINRHLYRQFELSSELTNAGIDLAIFPNYLMPLRYAGRSIIIIYDLSFISHPQFYSKCFVNYYTTQLKKTLSKEPLIITLSESSRESINRQLGVDKRKIYIVQPYSILKGNEFNNNPVGKDINNRPYFLYVGHIEPRKNLPFLINNFLEWNTSRKMNYKLIIAGELWLKSKEIGGLIEKYGIQADVEFRGYVSESELQSLYMNASAFVHAGIVEGFGFPVLEAMYFNLPILCSSGTGTEEISRPNSITFNPYDNFELKAGFDNIARLSKEELQYNIKYSPSLMQNQLYEVLTSISPKKTTKCNDTYQDTETAIEKTLLYYKLFNSGICNNLLHQFLIGKHVSGNELDAAVSSLLSKGIVFQYDNLIQLNIDDIKFYTRTKHKLDKNISYKLLQFINKTPFISSVAFSGGTANYGLLNHEDIDLFIITKPYTVYIVYFILHIYSLLMKSRKILCMNYLVDEKAMYINTNQDIYTAHQIISLKPYKNKLLINQFLNENRWVNNYYPNFHIPKSEKNQDSSFYLLISPLNSLIKLIYRKWYKKYLTTGFNSSVVLTEHVIKLHTKDYRSSVIEEFEHQWEKYSRRKDKTAVLI